MVDLAPLRAPTFSADPHPFYDRLRQTAPLCWVPATGAFWATRHADVTIVLSDRRFGKPQARTRGLTEGLDRAPRAMRAMWALRGVPLERARHAAPTMLGTDPPEHTRLRGLVQAAFTPRAIERLRTEILRITDGCIDRMRAARGDVDLVRALAFPLPATVIAELLGVPQQDQDRFRRWSGRLVRALDATQPQWARLDAVPAFAELQAYFDHLVTHRQAEPGEDLISGMIAARDGADGRLSGDELLSACQLLLVAGHETTTNLIGAGVLALLERPESQAWLREDLGRVETAVEELLRHVSPAQRVIRVALEDVDLPSGRVRRGENVAAVLGAANRDPAVFAEPHRLDLGRRPNPHLAFGRGIHFCLGAPLARLEAQVALSRIMERLPNLRLGARRPVWSRNTLIRGLVSLPVRV